MKLLIKTLFLGLISILSYIIFFINENWVIENFTKGNWFAILPIITAFIFSLIHGAFAGHFIKLLGFEEKKRE